MTTVKSENMIDGPFTKRIFKALRVVRKRLTLCVSGKGVVLVDRSYGLSKLPTPETELSERRSGQEGAGYFGRAGDRSNQC